MIKISTHDRTGAQVAPVTEACSWPDAAATMLDMPPDAAYAVAVEWQDQTIIGQPMMYMAGWARSKRIPAPFQSNRIDKANLIALSKLSDVAA